MSSYQDDTQETAVASDSTWGGLSQITDELAYVTAALVFGLTTLNTDSAQAADEVFDSRRTIVVEAAAATDQAPGILSAEVLIVETRKAVDLVLPRLSVLHSDSLAASDVVLDRQRPVIRESAAASDTVIAQRLVSSLVYEQAQVSDLSGQFTSSLSAETATISDVVIAPARMAVLVAEQAAVTDEATGSTTVVVAPVTETAAASGGVVFDQLRASALVPEIAIAADEQPGSEIVQGQAWTANTVTWAMSRYSPYTFTELAVVDGVAYGVADDGLYALSGGTENIGGSIKTGAIDMSGKELAHPTMAFVEYELEGAGAQAEMDVTTTQSGAALKYTYALPQETAAALTNGRFVFGRGLRGRHFGFELRLTGNRGHINDLRIETAPTKRRV